MLNMTKTLVAASLVLPAVTMAAGLAKSDEEFMQKAAEAGQFEVQASKLVDSKTVSADVKSFAGTMVKDHTAVGDKLKALATQKGVTIPEQPSKAQQKKIDKLSGLQGEKFEKEYADEVGVDAHKEAVSLFEKASKNAKDADVKNFFSSNLPALQHHLDMAKSLKDSAKKK